MTGLCAELEGRLLAPGWLAELPALLARLSTAVEAEQCIGSGLQRTSQSGNWVLFERYVLVAHRRPSRTYTATLCDVLTRRIEEVNNEDIVDVLAEVRDPTAVDCLEGTLRWQPPWDEFRQLAVKCVWALAATGTPEALAVLRDAAQCDAGEIREAARHQLKIANR